MANTLRTLAAAAVLNSLFAGAAAAFSFEVRLSGLELAESLSGSPEIASVYRGRNYQPVWTSGDGPGNARLQALIEALRSAPSHGLPFGEAESRHIRSLLALPGNEANAALAEAEISRIFVRFASSLNAGAVDPRMVASQISRKNRPPGTAALFAGITGPDPVSYMRNLAPDSHQYVMMRKELGRLDRIIRTGGWGEAVSAGILRPGDAGAGVIQLRNRLIRMGYLNRTSRPDFTGSMEFAVKRFQRDHGLDPDGIADSATLAALNVEPETRRQQVIAALERERWLNRPLGDEHVRVNIADFHADVISSGRPVFTTRVVVGKSGSKLQTPEFSDQMTHMVINPTWYVPRSITTEEILPQLQEDPAAEPLLEMFTQEDGIIDRSHVDFQNYTADNFPFDFKQPPGPKNALGFVKFMFPNKFNVYMHDTPQRNLFLRETRNFSHGCIRVHKATEFAHFLLDRMVDNPEEVYRRALALGDENTMLLPSPLPVHITYRTAFVGRDGRIHYRKDIYGRDGKVFERLMGAGQLTS